MKTRLARGNRMRKMHRTVRRCDGKDLRDRLHSMNGLNKLSNRKVVTYHDSKY